MKKGIIISFIFLVIFVLGCTEASSQAQKKDFSSGKQNLITRAFEDLVLGMSEADFKSKLQFYEMVEQGGLKTYVIYARSYALPRQVPMREIENIRQVFCYFF